MKLIIVRSFPSKLNINSYNVQEIGLAKALRRKNIQCDIVFFNGLSDTKTEILDCGVKIYWVKGINILKNGLFFNLRKIIDDYDIVQVHEYDQIQSWLLYTFSNKKVVIYHGPYFDSFNRGYNLKCIIFDSLFLPLSKKAKNNVRCLTKSPFATDFLLSKGFKNVSTVGVGLDVDSLNSDTSSDKFALSHDKFNAIYVGKLEERRNIEFLIDLAEIVYEQDNSFCLTIVGKYDGDEYKHRIEPKLESLIKKGIISYFEQATQKELSVLYRESDIFLFTTNYDIFGMVLLEAMYYGSVPISTSNGGSSTLIENGTDGFIMEEYDIKAWSKLILSLNKNREHLINLKSNAHDKIANKFLWDSLAPQFIATYNS